MAKATVKALDIGQLDARRQLEALKAYQSEVMK